jgi:hypothetical protein
MMPTPAQALRQARIVALAILAGQVVFLGLVAILVTTSHAEPPAAAMSRTFLAVAVFLFVALVPIAYLLRRRLLTPDGDGRVAPDVYLKGQIIFFGLCEMPTLMFLVVALVQEALAPAALLAMLSIGVQAVNLPKRDDLPDA